ncbi:MAG: glutathione S-transferase [Alphaproteobacteria bacterium]|nr:glutathione S-transferase [Alphaproteobacteria bacterium]
MSDLPILYSFRRCPYAIRARLAVWSSGMAVALREVVLRDKPQAFLEASPSATVPTLVGSDTTIIDESLDIMVWALSRHDPEGWLMPETGPHDDGLDLIDRNDGPFKHHLDRYKYHVRHAGCDPLAEREAAAGFLHDLDRRLVTAPWLFGARASLADMAILPFVRQFANVDRDWFDGQNWSGVRRWLREFEQSDRFVLVMNKYAAWSPGDPVTVFAAEPKKGVAHVTP